jgi:DNA helicase INO80
MPTLFDSHAEFYEWFSKDLENYAENQTALNERILSIQFTLFRMCYFHNLSLIFFLHSVGLCLTDQLKRLHMILKPFMLRRIKQDVENEMPPKKEIELKCELTPRQKFLYQGTSSQNIEIEIMSFNRNSMKLIPI